MENKRNQIIYWISTILVAIIFLGSAFMKLSGSEVSKEMSNGVGGNENLIILGILELVITLFWLIPKTGIIGTLLGIAYIGGAISIHFVNNQPITVPIIIQNIILLAAFCRFPELLQRIKNKL